METGTGFNRGFGLGLGSGRQFLTRQFPWPARMTARMSDRVPVPDPPDDGAPVIPAEEGAEAFDEEDEGPEDVETLAAMLGTPAMARARTETKTRRVNREAAPRGCVMALFQFFLG